MRYGLQADSSTETIEVVSANPREAEWLDVPHRRPLLAITRVTRNTDGRPFEFSYDLFRADRVRLTATMTSAVAQESRGVDGKVERVVSRLAAHRRPDDTLLA
ncbi:GntR family transcriptional regulator [Mycobacteroides abscessus subsp. abscessus]|nr:GntR family transcriptional regulator [Mycobacteroides abscessus subsp. abscessus]SLE73598.1 GntR family transcriptional regulator [Mycobacteroides abscessus subsp. massiliense]